MYKNECFVYFVCQKFCISTFILYKWLYVQCVITAVVGRPLMPSVYMLQQLIERAWSAGFDEAGRRQLGGKLVGTRKWIGATEIYALLTFLGVRSVSYTHLTLPTKRIV